MSKWLPVALILACSILPCVGATSALPEDAYKTYKPDFANDMPDVLKESSVQQGFYNRSTVATDQRADALITAAMKAEQSGDYWQAGKYYQDIIDKYPQSLMPLSQWGIFFPVSRYAQIRLLHFPPKELARYRLQVEGQARETYDTAYAHNSQEGLHDVVDYYFATQYGAKALWDLGNGALDRGEAENAARFFEQIREYFPKEDYNADDVASRLAMAYQQCNASEKLAALNKELKTPVVIATTLPGSDDFVPQRRNPQYQSFGDYAWWPAPATNLSGTERSWDVELPQAPGATADDQVSKGELVPFHLPWIVDNDLYYKHYNRVYCRSIVSGELRWECDLGILDRTVNRLVAYSTQTLVQADQDILVDDERVYANIRILGPRQSLVALDRVTGELIWSAGSFRPRTESDLTRRYDATPALGRKAIYAPWSQEEGELYTKVGISAFDRETGRLLWEQTLCQLAPTATTQKKMGVRVFSSSPLVKEGIIYEVTGAGVVAAIDEVSGTVLWLMRYPHYWSGAGFGNGVYDAHDEVTFGAPGMPGFGPQFRNHWPLLQGHRLYVAPFDSKRFYCLDKNSGKSTWTINNPAGPFEGIAPGGELLFSAGMTVPAGYPPPLGQRGVGCQFYRADTGQFSWEFFPTYLCTWHFTSHYPGRYNEMYCVDRPILTEDGRMLMATAHSPGWGYKIPDMLNCAYGEWCLSVTQRKLLDYRVCYNDAFANSIAGVLGGFIKNSKDSWRMQGDRPPENVNSPFDYDPTKRMPFKYHGVVCELLSSGDRLGMVYDVVALTAAVKDGQSARDIYTQAELELKAGRDQSAMDLLDKCLQAIKPEESIPRREIQRELFRLSRQMAWKALLAGDKKAAHAHLLHMAETANTAQDETQSLIAFAESFEGQGDVDRAAMSWVNLGKHYGQVVCDEVSAAGDSQASTEMLANKMSGAANHAPAGFTKEADLLSKSITGSLPIQFSTLSPAEPDLLIGASEYAARDLRKLLERHPDYRAQFEKRAEQALTDAGADANARLEAIAAFAGSKAAQKTIEETWDKSASAEPIEKQIQRWRLEDLALLHGIVPSPAAGDEARLLVKTLPPTSWGNAFADSSNDFIDYGENYRLLLPRADGGRQSPHLAFIGGRAKKRLDNKFSLECWDLQQDKKLWGGDSDIRLKTGDDEGFQDSRVCGDTVIVHGQNDVFAFNISTGDQRWRWQAPLDFNLQSVKCAGDIVVLAGLRQTMGVHRQTGQVIWSVEERGQLYCPPILRDDLLVTVRRDPCGVSFRRLQTGRLRWTIKLDELSENTTHPIFSANASRGTLDSGFATDTLPFADDGDLLMLSDRANYLAIDLAQENIRWRRPIDNNDSADPPMRFQISGPYLSILKRDYTSPAFYMLDAQTGDIKWMKKDQQAIFSAFSDPATKEIYGIAAPDPQKRGWTLKCLDAETGNEKRHLSKNDWDVFPETEILDTDGQGRLSVRILHGKNAGGELWLVDGKKMEVIQKLNIEGASAFGVAGGNSCVSQDGYWAALWPGKMHILRVQEGK